VDRALAAFDILASGSEGCVSARSVAKYFGRTFDEASFRPTIVSLKSRHEDRSRRATIADGIDKLY
jgi:hypothetical protein